jgi:hypothetical protein
MNQTEPLMINDAIPAKHACTVYRALNSESFSPHVSTPRSGIAGRHCGALGL